MNINRRKFLKNSAITAMGLGLASPLLERTALGALARGRGGVSLGTASDKIVVTLNLFGGNDGLNTVVPLYQWDRYKELRPTIAFDPSNTSPLSDTSDLALNPGMTAMSDLYARGKVAVITGMGAPQDANGLFDHERSQYEMVSADVTDEHFASAPTGWLGRYLDTVGEGVITPGIDFGGGRLVLAGDYDRVASGERREALTIGSIEDFQIRPGGDSEARLAAYRRVMDLPNSASGVAERNRVLRVQALEQSEIVIDRTQNYEPAVEYPNFDENYLAYSLYQSAKLISSDLGVRALSVGYDGYDTHAAQNDGESETELGYHAYKMMSVSNAVAAFQADIEAHGMGDKVVLVIFSEFGRRPEENNDRGTDHGFGSVGFVVGNSVRGGVYGEHPSLDEDHLVLDGNVDVTTDFRSVYATILANHMGADPEPILNGSFPLLNFIR